MMVAMLIATVSCYKIMFGLNKDYNILESPKFSFSNNLITVDELVD